MRLLSVVAFFVVLLSPFPLPATDAETQIKAVLDTQIEAWNRGDLKTFVTTYAPDCTFVGKQVTQGSADLLAHYQKTYPNSAAMGHLTFSNRAVRLLDNDVAIVTANWHLDRTPASGGPTGGIFSLVVQRKSGSWKIALDHTA